jgi:Transcriptional regulator
MCAMESGNTAEDDEGKPAGRAPEGMAGLAKGLQIIEAFASERREMSVTRAAQAAGISRASARRCLLTLEDLGYLSRIGSAFLPTPRLLRLGAAYFEAATLPKLAQVHLDAARDQLNESVSLAVMQDDEAVMVARAQVSRPIATYATLGVALPAYASATGRVLLAAQTDAEIRDYLARTALVAHSPRTVTDPEALFEIIIAVRSQGVSFSIEQFELGIQALAVPVVDRLGHTVAAVSISASMARIAPDKAQEEYLPVIRKCAQAISRLT